MKKLRPYQSDFVNAIRYSLAANKSVIGCMATGGGKTIVFSDIARAALEKGRTVLIQTESRKIFPQIVKDLPQAIEIKAGNKLDNIEAGGLYVCMSQTIMRRPHLIEQFSTLANNVLLISDESHVGTVAPLIRELPNAFKVSFTATPDGAQGPHLVELHKDCIVGAQPAELVKMGFLAPYRHFMRELINEKNLSVKGGEFTDDSQYEAFKSEKVYEQLYKDLSTEQYKKCIIFCSSIKHAGEVSEILHEKGYVNLLVHSEVDYDLELFTKGHVNICVSVGILTKGFDCPPIDLCILLRATKSLALYLQMCGRASRISEGKEGFMVLDYGKNGTRHGRWDSDFKWHERWKATKKEKGDGPPAMKLCPKCMALLPAAATSCFDCGYVYPAKKEEKVSGKIVERELTAFKVGQFDNRNPYSLNPEELAFLGLSKGNLKAYWSIALDLDNQQPDYLKRFGKAAGYHPKWWISYKYKPKL